MRSSNALTDRRCADFWLTSFYLDHDASRKTSALTIPGRDSSVPVLITERVEARVGADVAMLNGCPELPAL